MTVKNPSETAAYSEEEFNSHLNEWMEHVKKNMDCMIPKKFIKHQAQSIKSDLLKILEQQYKQIMQLAAKCGSAAPSNTAADTTKCNSQIKRSQQVPEQWFYFFLSSIIWYTSRRKNNVLRELIYHVLRNTPVC